MFEKFGEFDSYEEINRAAKAQLEEGDLEAIKTIAEENGLDPEDAEDFCTSATEEREEKRVKGSEGEAAKTKKTGETGDGETGRASKRHSGTDRD